MTSHLIDELVFDIAIDSRNRTMREDAYLSRLVTATLLPVIEEVFDGFDDGDTVLVLPWLEIDLGAIVEADYEATAVERLRAALGDALQRALADARQPRGAGGAAASAGRGDVAATIVSRHESELAQLGRFLDTGTMPWHADIGQARLHEALLDRLLARAGAGLWTVLARALADPCSARRLVGQFPEHQLLAVLRGSAGARAGLFEALLAQFKQRPPGAALLAAAWVQVLAACTAAAAADPDVDLHAACARICTALAPSAAGAQVPPHADIDLLAHFLDSGVLPLGSKNPDQSEHEALLERLLKHGGDELRSVLARALAQPRTARRLVEQFSQRQLLAVLRRMAGAHSAQFESLLEEATPRSPGRAGGAPAAIWVRVLAACTDSGYVDAQAQCARIRACLAHPADDANASSTSDIGLLAHFLDSGQLPAGRASLTGQPAHEAQLDRHLAQGAACLWPVLSAALAEPHSAHRLVTQFPEHQLLGIVRSTAGARAEPFETLLAEAKFAATAWVRVLAACTGNAGAVDAEAACAHIRAARGRTAAGAGASSMPDIDLLADFLDSGQLLRAPGGAVGQPAHEALFDRLLAQGAASLWPVLSAALAEPHSARRLVEQFPERQLLAVLRQAAPADAVQYEALLAEALQGTGGAQTMSMAWRLVLAQRSVPPVSGAGVRLALAKIGSALAPYLSTCEHPDSTAAPPRVTAVPAGVQRLVARFPGNPWPGLPQQAATAASARRLAVLAGGEAGAGAEAATMAWRRLHADSRQTSLLQEGGGAVWSVLARSLASPARARRLVERFPQHQMGAVVQRLAPAQATQRESLLTQTNHNPASMMNTSGHAAPAAPLQGGSPAPTDDAPRAADDAIERTSGQGAQSYRVQLRHLLRFLESGSLPRAAGTDQAHLHVALLDDVIGRADDALWPIVAHALEHADSAARLLAHFPPRQLIALGRKSAPGYAPALERLGQRLSAMQADGSGAGAAGNGRQAQVWRRHVLAACVARPAINALPARVYARVALELSGKAAPAAQTSYAHRLDAPPAGATVPWRASRAERGAGLALVRLAGMVEQFRPLIDDSGASTPALAPIVAPTGLGLVLRQREQMARSLLAKCCALEALLSGHTARPDAPGAASIDDVAALRTAIAAQVGANPAIALRRKALMLESIGAKLEQAENPARFLRGVLAVVTSGAPLDLDALPTPDSPVAAAPKTPTMPTHMLAAALMAGDAAAVSAHWQTLLHSHAPQIRAGLRHYGRNAPVRRALAQALPHTIFIGLAGLLDGGAPAILREVLTPSAPLQDAVGRGAPWNAWTMRCRLHALTTLINDPAGGRRMEAGAFLRGLAPADSQLHANLLDALPAQFAAAAGPAAQQDAAPAPLPQSRAGRVGDAAAPVFPAPVDSTDLLVVGNAGVVLAGPYLPRLFNVLGLTVDGKFIDEHAAGRAVQLLQYMATGESHAPEYLLVLNKILCGLPTAAPVPAGIDVSPAEQECIEAMIQAMVAHAKVLGSCSVAAMRQTFFARKADLRLIEDAWQLRVHPGTFDMLLDRLPWGYSIIKFGWMARPVHVEWRPA